MTIPSVTDAVTFFQSDANLNTISTDRISYWLNDIANKNIVISTDFGSLYFNAFMNLLGHYLTLYETNIVSNYGPVTSESVAAVSRSYSSYDGDDPERMALNLTKYGRIFDGLLDRLAVTHGGMVATGGFSCFPYW